jgi:hypothetical protein
MYDIHKICKYSYMNCQVLIRIHIFYNELQVFLYWLQKYSYKSDKKIL